MVHPAKGALSLPIARAGRAHLSREEGAKPEAGAPILHPDNFQRMLPKAGGADISAAFSPTIGPQSVLTGTKIVTVVRGDLSTAPRGYEASEGFTCSEASLIDGGLSVHALFEKGGQSEIYAFTAESAIAMGLLDASGNVAAPEDLSEVRYWFGNGNPKLARAMDPSTPPKELESLWEDPNLREAIAANAALPLSLMGKAAGEHPPAFLGNPSVALMLVESPDFFERLPDESLIGVVFQFPDEGCEHYAAPIGMAALRRDYFRTEAGSLAKRPLIEFWLGLKLEPFAPEERQGFAQLYASLALNRDCTSEMLERLAEKILMLDAEYLSSPFLEVLTKIALNPNVTDSILQRIREYQRPEELIYFAQRYDASPVLLHFLATDPSIARDAGLRRMLIEHPKTEERTLAAMAREETDIQLQNLLTQKLLLFQPE